MSVELTDLTVFRKGKVRDIYDLGDELLFIVTDRISAHDVIMNQGIPGKGEMLNKISEFWFNYLRDVVPNHVITADFESYPEELRKYPQISGRSMIVKKVERIDVECVVRGYISGSGWKQYKNSEPVDDKIDLYGNKIPTGLVESDKLPQPIFTPATKADDGHDENIPLERFYDIVGSQLGDQIIEVSLRLYKTAYDYAYTRGLIIADTKFEFGLDNGQLILIDEVLTPDSSRFWSVEKYQPGRGQDSFDKQYLRDYLSGIDWNKEPPPPDLPEEVIENTARKYREAFNLLTKQI
ncbi:MAG: phosphoribosylaminoimidazolesuccinocarboxamide synthase [candidate division Zixibacteria bacterium]|nr:phosphoribosylaminoimidazolesuccinocarboxamide synthase [candidate division Zixibacteria bacterium]